jgi:hypothetical protein
MPVTLGVVWEAEDPKRGLFESHYTDGMPGDVETGALRRPCCGRDDVLSEVGQ